MKSWRYFSQKGKKMGEPSFRDIVRGWIGGVAFAVLLWANRMTAEEYWLGIVCAEVANQERLLQCPACDSKLDLHVSKDGIFGMVEW